MIIYDGESLYHGAIDNGWNIFVLLEIVFCRFRKVTTVAIQRFSDPNKTDVCWEYLARYRCTV